MKRLLLIALACPLVSFADPGPATTYLIEEPASLMDIVIMRLDSADKYDSDGHRESFAEAAGAVPTEVSGGAHYDYENDLIVIRINVFDLERVLPSAQAMEVGCRKMMDLKSSVVNTLASTFFLHAGYTKKNAPKDIIQKIKKRVQVVCSVMTSEAPFELFTAESMLLSDDVAITTHKSLRKD